MKKVLLILGFVGIATLAQANTTKSGEKCCEAAKLSVAEVAELMGQEEAEIASFFALETQTVKIYNTQDELVMEGTLDVAGQTENAALAKALRNSGRIMTVGDTHIYRMED